MPQAVKKSPIKESVTNLISRIYDDIINYWENNFKPYNIRNYDHSTTTYDKICEQLIYKNLMLFDHPWIAYFEERGYVSFKNNEKNENFYFIIDALDGTNNLLMGFPFFTTSIAIFYKGKPFFGIVIFPLTKSYYWAFSDTTAYFSYNKINHKIQVSKVENINSSNISYLRPKDNISYQNLEKTLCNANKIRLVSCISLELCWIAQGSLDLYFDLFSSHSNKILDLAAGSIILKSAGGVIKSFYNAQLFDIDFFHHEPFEYIKTIAATNIQLINNFMDL